MIKSITHIHLEKLYDTYNQRSFVHPDPLEFLYRYKDKRDIEIVGMIASSLAYGRVAQILKSVSYVLEIMGASPYRFLKDSTYKSLCINFNGFTHRFAKGTHLAALLFSIKKIVSCYGSLNNCFAEEILPEHETVIPAMTTFVEKLTIGKNKPGHLIALPEKKSACKRMNLFLRWMVRNDSVDLGSWTEVSPSQLVIPTDTHLHKICLFFGFTKRKQADMKTALEITSNFKKIVPNDPVKYDFALTRFGIRDDMSIEQLFTTNFK